MEEYNPLRKWDEEEIENSYYKVNTFNLEDDVIKLSSGKEVICNKLQDVPEDWYVSELSSVKKTFGGHIQHIFNPKQWLTHFKFYSDPTNIIAGGHKRGKSKFHRMRLAIQHGTWKTCRNGWYISMEEGKDSEKKYTVVELDFDFMHESIRKTTIYHSEPSVTASVVCDSDSQRTLVVLGDCLELGLWLKYKAGLNPLVLNMANGNTPGGGYRGGSGAQEENLHRRTNYYQSLEDPDHIQTIARKDRYPMSPTGAIYSPNLIVFRQSESKGYGFLDKPRLMSFIAAAAIRHPAIVSRSNPMRMKEEDTELMRSKISTILAVALDRGHDSIVLSAFGCGAYKCPPNHVAELFKEEINSPKFKGKFRVISFGIFDDHNSKKKHNPKGNVQPFAEIFGVEPVPVESLSLDLLL